jgi:hypothetical protein
MSQLVVDDQNELKEIDIKESPKYSFALRIAARIISYLFHPLFIPVYVSWFLVYLQPYLFSSFNKWDKALVILRFFVMYTLFPLITVLLAKGLGFVSSIQLKTQRERIIPYIACGMYYFWMWYVLHNQPEFPAPVVSLTFAIFLASSIGLLANIYMKISMHTIGMGVMVTFIILLAFTQDTSFGIYIALALFISGVVCTARMIASDHTQLEIYFGFFVGVVSQLIAWYFF